LHAVKLGSANVRRRDRSSHQMCAAALVAQAAGHTTRFARLSAAKRRRLPVSLLPALGVRRGFLVRPLGAKSGTNQGCQIWGSFLVQKAVDKTAAPTIVSEISSTAFRTAYGSQKLGRKPSTV